MKLFSYKKTIIFIFIGLILFASKSNIYCQQKTKYVTVDIVLDNLIFGHRFNRSIDEINSWLIKQIQERKVDFELRTEEENSFKKIGASDLLLKTIRGNYSKTVQERISLYKKFTDNYNGTPEQQKIAIEAAKEFVEKYSDDPESKQIIEYFKNNIPAMEKYLNDKKP